VSPGALFRCQTVADCFKIEYDRSEVAVRALKDDLKKYREVDALGACEDLPRSEVMRPYLEAGLVEGQGNPRDRSGLRAQILNSRVCFFFPYRVKTSRSSSRNYLFEQASVTDQPASECPVNGSC